MEDRRWFGWPAKKDLDLFMSSPDHDRILHEAAGVLERSARGTVAVEGADRASYLQGLLTNDIVALSAGRGCYAAYLTPQGRMIADMRVIETGDAILLDVHASVTDALVDRLSRLIFSEDVQISDRTADWIQYGVRGPQSATVTAAALTQTAGARAVEGPSAAALAGFAEHQHGCWPFEHGSITVVRSDEAGVMGFDLATAPELRDRVHHRVAAAGAVDVVQAAVEVLRVEAGRPMFPVDMDEDTIPLEAGIEDRAISLTKGCYVGQEVIIRVLHRGHGRVARKLVGLVVAPVAAEAPMPAPGDRVEVNDLQIGRVTTAVRSPVLGPIALGYVHRDFVAPGTAVRVVHGDRRLDATVSRLPFPR